MEYVLEEAVDVSTEPETEATPEPQRQHQSQFRGVLYPVKAEAARVQSSPWIPPYRSFPFSAHFHVSSLAR